jgi:hypothetical protein
MDASHKLPRYNVLLRGSLFDDIEDLASLLTRSTGQVDVEALGILFKHITEQPHNDELIWSAVYELIKASTPFSPVVLHEKRSSPISPVVLHDMNIDWSRNFFEDALVGLQQQMKDCVNDTSMYYAKTLVFVQSSGMGKSRLADSFGRICPMINFVLRENGDGYPMPDHQVRDFMCGVVPNILREIVTRSPLKKGGPNAKEFPERRLANIWNHSLAFAILDASIKKCESRVPLIQQVLT